MKKCLFLQNAGLGDLLFLSKAAALANENGYTVYWPIAENLLYVKDYLVKYDIIWMKSGEEGGIHFDEVIDFSTADRHFSGSVLEAKYRLINQDYSDWARYLHIERNYNKEEKLFNSLGLEGKEYTFINRRFGTLPHFAQKEVPYNKNDFIVEMQILDGITPFDWCKVIERANKISIVDTSLNYVMETLPLRAVEMTLTSRFTPANFTDIQNLFTDKWIKNDT